MNRGMNDASRDLWLPVLVVALGWALSLAAWGWLVAERRQVTLDATGDLADEARQVVADGVEAHLLALEELAHLWALVGRRPIDHWRADVGMLMRSFPAIDYVAWIDPDEDSPRLHLNEARTGVPSPLLVSPADLPDSALIGPERTHDGKPSFRFVLPVAEGEDQGWLEARVDLSTLLTRILRGKSRGHALRIRWEDEEIFARGLPSTDPWQDWWLAERTVELPDGSVWQIVHRPTETLAATLLTPIPHYLLVTGLALSLALGVLTHQLRVTRRQTRFLGASSHALEQRGHELERNVALRTAELEEAVSELRAVNQAVSHDLRSPLGAVLNFTTILEEDYHQRTLDDEGLAVLARIRRSASRAVLLLEGLSQLSRVGRAPLEMEEIDMRGLAQDIFAQVRAAEDDPDVELVIEELPPVQGDRALLGNVLSNLFTNSLKYSRGYKKRRVEVRGTIDVDACVYEVADNGQGFDMRFAGKLFGMFERLHTDEEVEGTGVGLAIVQRIVRRHGGRVWGEGAPGEGARFFVALPRPGEHS